MKYYSKWYEENRERLLSVRRKYNKEYSSRPEVIEKARIRNSTPEAREKRKLYKKTIMGKIAEHKDRNKRYSKTGFEKHLIQRYGISANDYNDIFSHQKGVCAICWRKQSTKLHVDHCHTTGVVRGLLCGNCNRALGLMKDNVDFLSKAIIYLQK